MTAALTIFVAWLNDLVIQALMISLGMIMSGELVARVSKRTLTEGKDSCETLGSY